MPVWLRRSLIVLAVLLALLAAGAVWLVATFDANRYKGLLVDWVRENKQRTLSIDGPIGLAVFPRLAVTLQGVTLSEHRGPDEFASLKEAQLAVQVLPLLRRELAIDRVAARGVRVVYTRNAQGDSNIDDLLGPAPGPTAGAPTGKPQAVPRFDVSAIELADLQAEVKDEVLGIDGRFVVQTLETGRLADGATSPVRLVGQARLQRPAVDAAIDVDGQLALTLPADGPPRIAVSDLKLGLRGQGFDVQKLEARLTGALAYDGASGALRADDLQLLLSGERLGVALQDSALRLASLSFEPAVRKVALESMDVKLAGRSGGNTLAAALTWPRLQVSGDALEGSPLKGSASVEGSGSNAQRLQLGFESQAPSGSFERIRVPGLKVTVNGTGGGRSVRGESRTDLTLTPQPVAAVLEALTLQLAFTDPALPPTNLTLQGHARGGEKDASWAFDGALNGQKFNTTGKADLSGEVPAVQTQARFATLDLTRFVAKPVAGAKPAAPSQDAGPADAPLDLSGLRSLDGSFTLRAGSLVYPPYRVTDAALDATLTDGTLRVSRLAGRSWGGQFNAQGSAQAAKTLAAQRVAFKLEASGIDIAALLRDVADFRKLEGKGRVSADVFTTGASVAQFKQQLAGKAAMQLNDGAVRGINLAKVLRQWRSAVTLNKDAVQAASAEEKTDFSEISASFDIRDGVARNRDLAAKSPFLRVTGEGLIDLGKDRIDYLARATVTATSQGQGGADLAALRGVTVPVQLVGPFEAVDYQVQWSAVAADLVGNRAKEAVKEKARGAVGGLLEGLGGARPPSGAGSAPARKDPLKDGLDKLFGR